MNNSLSYFIRPKIYLLAIFLLALNHPGMAQVDKTKKIFHLAVKSVRFSGDVASKEAFLFKPSIEVGFGIQLPINKHLSFNPEINLAQRGHHGKMSFSDSTYSERTITLNYLDLNPNFELTLGRVSEFSSNFSIWGGPYFGIGLWDNTFVENRIINPAKPNSYITVSNSSESFSSDFRRIDAGIKFGIGIVSKRFVAAGFTYQAGLANITASPIKTYNQSLGFYFRVFFDDMF
ncbi:PorT family protein [Cytophagaceae bacterium 50C-KIRBA]|uniref:PorT family protein n=1 Tax=Aquirufa beregesia TaxID=2516556 RepID=A0ABX0EX08_9BACT|nr:porin family protein [Aquirufa beregesia]NGZ43923.1 PorT family protein [Aquirufa beregesia]